MRRCAQRGFYVAGLKFRSGQLTWVDAAGTPRRVVTHRPGPGEVHHTALPIGAQLAAGEDPATAGYVFGVPTPWLTYDPQAAQGRAGRRGLTTGSAGAAGRLAAAATDHADDASGSARETVYGWLALVEATTAVGVPPADAYHAALADLVVTYGGRAGGQWCAPLLASQLTRARWAGFDADTRAVHAAVMVQEAHRFFPALDAAVWVALLADLDPAVRRLGAAGLETIVDRPPAERAALGAFALGLARDTDGPVAASTIIALPTLVGAGVLTIDVVLDAAEAGLAADGWVGDRWFDTLRALVRGPAGATPGVQARCLAIVDARLAEPRFVSSAAALVVALGATLPAAEVARYGTAFAASGSRTLQDHAVALLAAASARLDDPAVAALTTAVLSDPHCGDAYRRVSQFGTLGVALDADALDAALWAQVRALDAGECGGGDQGWNDELLAILAETLVGLAADGPTGAVPTVLAVHQHLLAGAPTVATAAAAVTAELFAAVELRGV